MAVIDKQIFTSWNSSGDVQNLYDFLEEKGFYIDEITTGQTWRFYWNNAGTTSDCYWEVKNGGLTINFHKSNWGDDHTEYAFRSNLGFEGGKSVGAIFMELADGGCVLYLTALPPRTSITELTFCCENEWKWDPTANNNAGDWVLNDTQLLHNGLVVVTPAEQDGYWRYSWRSQDDTGFYWDVDNGHGTYEYGKETHQIPQVKLVNGNECCTLVKVILQNGGWSEHMRVLVLGEITPPGNVFKINGQKFITFTDNTKTRCPAFKLPAESRQENIPTSTEEYSSLKTYQVGDFCIFEGSLWKCIKKVKNPMPFDDTYWKVTTVNQEIMSQSIYETLETANVE